MRRSLVALSCALFLTASFSTAEARPRQHHGVAKHQVVKKKVVRKYKRSRIQLRRVPAAEVERQWRPEQQSFFGGFQQGFDSGYSAGSGAVARARQFIGASAREVGVRSSLWCSAFLRKVTGASGVDDRALSWENKPRIAPQVGAIATMSRGKRGGGHVGIVSGFDAKGNPIIVSGNHGNRVAESVYPKSRIRGYFSAS